MRKGFFVVLAIFAISLVGIRSAQAQVPTITIDPPVPSVVMTDGPNPTPDVVFNVTVENATNINITEGDITIHTRRPNVRQVGNQPAAVDQVVVLNGNTPNPTIILPGSGIHGDGYIWIEIAGSTCSNDEGDANDALSPEFRVDATPPDVRLTAADGNPTRAMPCDPTTGMLTFNVEFIDESESVIDFDASDVLINGVSATDPDCYEVAAHFPSGASCLGPACEVSGSGKLYTVVIYPRTDGPFTIQIAGKAALDDVGWESTASNEVTVPYTDAPRINIQALSPDNTNSKTISFMVEFSKPVHGFGLGDVRVDPPTTPGVAGGTKTIVVTGTGEPLSEGQVYYVGVSGCTYSGYVRLFIDCSQDVPDQSDWWSSEDSCTVPQVNYDGTPPHSLAITTPSGLPQPPAYSGEYTTSATKIDIAGTAADDVGISRVTWTNDRGGSGPCVGTSTWYARGIYLKPGRNLITITASDAAGNTLSYYLTVNCTNPYWSDTVDANREDVQRVGEYSSIALDASGNPRIAYYYYVDGNHGVLRYAYYDGQAWHVENVDGNSPGSVNDDVGRYTSIKIDAQGNPHISYYDVTNGDLMYAVWRSGTWQITTVDGTTGSTDNVGQFTSLALYNGLPRIAYYDVANGDLKYASYDGSRWTKVTVDSAGDVGRFASLALDPNTGYPRIAYYDFTNRDLKYAAYDGSTWNTSVVASDGDVGQYCSLALDPVTGRPRISYYDGTNKDLVYAAWDGSSWVFSTVDSDGDVGRYCSLALYNGLPRIAYYDGESSRRDLKYAEGDSAVNPDWTLSVIDDGVAEAGVSTYDVGQYASLAIDSSGGAHISYYDATLTPLRNTLKYAYRASGPTCVVEPLDPSPTNLSPVKFKITFSNPVSGFSASKVLVSEGTAGALTQIDTTSYRLEVYPNAVPEPGNTYVNVRVKVPAGAARYGTLDNVESNEALIQVDRIPPSVQVNQDYVQPDPSGASSPTVVYFTAVFSEPVTGFTASDVVISGSAGGTKSIRVLGEGTHYLISVTGITTAGSVIASVPANAAFDAAGNGNLASTSTDNMVWWDHTPPTCTINQASGLYGGPTQNDPTSNPVINFTVVFSEPVIGFGDRTDVVVDGTASFTGPNGQSTLNVEITPIGTPDAFGRYRTYNVAVSGMQTKGTVTCSVPAGVAFDCVPTTATIPINGNLASTSTDNIVTYDATPVTCTINQKDDQPDPTNTQPVRFTVTFSKDVTGFEPSDVQLSGTAVSRATVTITGSGRNYTVAVSGLSVPPGQTTAGTVIANIPAGVVQDSAGNTNLPASYVDNVVRFDNVGPNVTVNQAASQVDSTSESSIHFTAVFSEPVFGFETSDVVVSGTASDPQVLDPILIKPGGTFEPDTIVANHGDVIRWRNDTGSAFALEILTDAGDTVDTLNLAPGEIKSFSAFWGSGVYRFQRKSSPAVAGTITLNPVLLATITELPPYDKTVYDIEVSGMVAPGSVRASIRAGVAQDALGNTNSASVSTDNTVLYLPELCQTSSVAIPDNDTAGVESTIDLSYLSGSITDVNVRLTVSHNYISDLSAYLIGPDGTQVTLFEHVGGKGSGFVNTVLDDEADSSIVTGRAPFTGSYKPVDLLAKFDGKKITGQWKLKVVDDRPDASGVLQSWCLQIQVQDTDNPVCTITAPSGSACISPIDFAVTFNEPVRNLTKEDFVINNGQAVELVGSNASYVLSVEPVNAGKVDVTLPAGAASDPWGNATTKSVTASATYAAPPTVTINQAATQADPTAASVINFTVVFSEPVTGFGADDVILGGTAGASNVVVTGYGSVYNVAVSGMKRSGTVIASVRAGAAVGQNGCPSLASTSTDNVVTYDITPVSVTINQAPGQPDPTTVLPIKFSVVFSKSVVDFDPSDVSITGTAGGTKTVTVKGTGASYTVEVSGVTSSGTVIASIPAGVVHDALGNANTASTSTDNVVWFDDGTSPQVAVSPAQDQRDPTNESPVRFLVVFNKIVSGFGDSPSDVVVGGTAFGAGAVKTVDFTETDGGWIVAVSGMTQPGRVSMYVPAGVACDAGGKCNTASNTASVVYDNEGPSVTVNQAADQADPTDSDVINFTVEFSEPVRGFEDGDVAISGTAGASSAKVTEIEPYDGTRYNVAVTGMSQTGTVVVDILPDVAEDLAGNGNLASTSTDNEVTYDTPPSVTINQAATQKDPTATSPIVFVVVFSEPVIGFGPSAVEVSGTAFGPGAVKSIVVKGDGPTYTVEVRGMNQSGTVIASVPGGVVRDVNGFVNRPSTSTDNTVTYDITRPTVTVNQAKTQSDPTKDSPINFTVVFSKTVIGFTADKVTVTGSAFGSGAVPSVIVTGSGRIYNVAVSGMNQTGTVVASVEANKVQDVLGNWNVASTSTDNVVTYDVTGPSVTVNQAADQADPTSSSPIKFTVVFSEPVNDFEPEDVSVSGSAFSAAAQKTVTVTPSSGPASEYTVLVSGMDSVGTVRVTVPAGVAHDVVGNPNTASTSTDNVVRFDNSELTVTVNQAEDQPDPTKDSPIYYKVVFSKAVKDFTSEDVQVSGTAGGTKKVKVVGSGTTYTVSVSGMNSSGTVVVTVPAGVAHDAAGNANQASTSDDNVVTYDITPPTIKITRPTEDESCVWNCGTFKVGGEADDNVSLAVVTWQTGGGNSGVCSGTTTWTASGIDIGNGDTVIVTAIDEAGNTATDTIDVEVRLALPAEDDWVRLAMVSVPIIPFDKDPKLVVGFHSNYWVSYDPVAGAYLQYPDPATWFDPTSSAPGRGFWAGFIGGPTTTPAGIVPDQTQPVVIQLKKGWNLIGQPFINAVPWDLTKIVIRKDSQEKSLEEARDAGWVRDYAWGWQPDRQSESGGEYYLVYDPAIIPGSVGELKPWRAYWFRALVDCDLILPPPVSR
jgi:subtilisin-like proprotein convertase family protein